MWAPDKTALEHLVDLGAHGHGAVDPRTSCNIVTQYRAIMSSLDMDDRAVRRSGDAPGQHPGPAGDASADGTG
jgi:hypothetical protein